MTKALLGQPVGRGKKSKVKNFKKNTTYNIVQTEENAFINIDIKEIIQEAEAEEEEDEEESTFDDQKTPQMKFMTLTLVIVTMNLTRTSKM